MAEVSNLKDQSRYEIRLDGRSVGFLDYVDRGDVVVLPHTEIDPSYEGRGLGAELVSKALDDLRQQGRTIRPACSFVQHFVTRHPEYADLVQGS